MDWKSNVQEDDLVLAVADLHLEGHVLQHAPVLGEGTVAGKPFLFRARGDYWHFAVSDNPEVDVTDVLFCGEKKGFYRSATYGSELLGSASSMPHADAEKLILQCVMEYLESRSLSGKS